MIWQESVPNSLAVQGVGHALRQAWEPLLQDHLQNPGLLTDVCSAVATAWQVELGGHPLPQPALCLMGSRALWVAGERDAARELAESAAEGSGAAERWMNLIENGGLSLAACVCVGAGLLRPSASALNESSPVWVMEVGRLTTAGSELAELGLPSRMARVLSRTAEVWDAANGRGVLILSAVRTPPTGPVRAFLRTTGPEICCATLDRLQGVRGWPARPEVRRGGFG